MPIERFVSCAVLCFALVSFLPANPVAHVGDVVVTAKDLAYRTATERAYGNVGMDDATALVAIVNDLLEENVAAAVGVAATDEEVAALSAHADTTTKAPLILSRVKAAFGQDVVAYRRMYLAPKVTNRKLHDFFQAASDLQQPQRARAEAALAAVAGGQTFAEVANETGATLSTFEVPRTATLEGMPPSALVGVLDGLEVGAQHPAVFEDGEGFQILRLVTKTDDTYGVEALAVAKVRFDEWFHDRAAAVSIQVEQTALAQAIVSRYAGVWWVGRLAGD